MQLRCSGVDGVGEAHRDAGAAAGAQSRDMEFGIIATPARLDEKCHQLLDIPRRTAVLGWWGGGGGGAPVAARIEHELAMRNEGGTVGERHPCRHREGADGDRRRLGRAGKPAAVTEDV